MNADEITLWEFPLFLARNTTFSYDENMSEVLMAKDIKLDSKHRVTVSKPIADHYRMKYYDDGHIVLEPMELISKKVVDEMREAVDLVKKGAVGSPVDMPQVASILDE